LVSLIQVHNPLLTPEYYEKYLRSINIPYTRDPWQIEIGKKKIRLKDEPLYLRETVDRRGRGASKTFDTMEQNIFLAVIGYRGIWFSSGRDQLEQPKIYLKYIIDRSKLLQSQLTELLKESVTFKSGGTLKLKNLTELNARSGRADFITYDEEAQADEASYNAAVSILAGSNLGFVFHISTPAKATVFEENYERINRRQKETGVELTFKVPWYKATWLYQKKEWYEELKKVKEAQGQGWYFRQEHLAEFELPQGAVFQNVVYTPYPAWLEEQITKQPNCSGVDWNPAAGHVRSTVKWTPDLQSVVVVGEAMFSVGYAREMKLKEFMVLRKWFSHGNRMVLEDGGINIPYIDWFNDMLEETRHGWVDQRWSAEEWDNQDIAKMKACNFIAQHGITIYVDEMRFPKTAKQIQECSWDEDAKGSNPKLKKDSANSPHYLDAFLHAISDKNRDDYEYEVADW
jgi:hypothetical protein